MYRKVMKRHLLPLLLIIVILFSPVQADQSRTPPGTFLADIVLFRPLGLVTTIVGSAIFVGISPLTAFASIPKPHNAFEKAAQFLINEPAKFTFVRPLGVYYPDEKGLYRAPK